MAHHKYVVVNEDPMPPIKIDTDDNSPSTSETEEAAFP